MSISLENGPEAHCIATPRLRLVFRWEADRWSHAVEVGSEEEWHRAASSVEASDHAGDPAVVDSPTYQEIDVRLDGDTALALLVGRHGAHHFSAAFRVHEDDARGQPETFVAVDVAVRSRGPLSGLAATYLVHAPAAALQWSSDSGACWSLADDRFQLILEKEPGANESGSIGVEKSGRRTFRCQAEARLTPGAATQRLIYGWICSDFRDSPTGCDLNRLTHRSKPR